MIPGYIRKAGSSTASPARATSQPPNGDMAIADLADADHLPLQPVRNGHVVHLLQKHQHSAVAGPTCLVHIKTWSAGAPRSPAGAAACFPLGSRLDRYLRALFRWRDGHGLGCGDTVRPNITLERCTGSDVRIGL